MPRRSKNWNENLSKKLRNKKFAKHYLLSLVKDEGLPLKQALRETIQAYGISEFSKLCGLAQPNVSRALEKGSNPTLTTLEKLLSPFELSIGLQDKKHQGKKQNGAA